MPQLKSSSHTPAPPRPWREELCDEKNAQGGERMHRTRILQVFQKRALVNYADKTSRG